METARGVLTSLAWRYAFGDVVALTVDGVVHDVDARRVRALCAFGHRLLELDAEDFGVPDSCTDGVPSVLLDRARASRMPQRPEERSRGALTSLRPAYALLLEVIEARWHRRELAALVAAVHIAAEYLPLLAWEPVLGHAADPARLPSAVTGKGSRFGVIGSDCAHHGPEQSAADRALRVAGEPAPGWRAYLDRQHSHLARGMGVCAARCRRQCSVISRLDDSVREPLTERCQIAMDFGDSALVRLRHTAPVGHGFGVPSTEEISDAWARTRASLSKYPLARRAFAEPEPQRVDRPDAGRRWLEPETGQPGSGQFPLPGLPGLFSVIAGVPIAPDTLLFDVARTLAGTLDAE